MTVWLLIFGVGAGSQSGGQSGGTSVEGAYFAAWNFVFKASFGVTLMLTGFVLSWSGFVPKAEQTETVKLSLRTLYAIYPLVCFVGGALGSQASASLYAYLGWSGVVGLGMSLSLIAAVYGIAVRSARIPDHIEARA